MQIEIAMNSTHRLRALIKRSDGSIWDLTGAEVSFMVQRHYSVPNDEEELIATIETPGTNGYMYYDCTVDDFDGISDDRWYLRVRIQQGSIDIRSTPPRSRT